MSFHSSEAGDSCKLPVKLELVYGFILVACVAKGCSINVSSVYSRYTLSPLRTTPSEFAESNNILKLFSVNIGRMIPSDGSIDAI